MIAERRAQLSTAEDEIKVKKVKKDKAIESREAWSACMKWREQRERELEEKRKNWGKEIHRKVETSRAAKSLSQPQIGKSTKSKFGLRGERSWSVGIQQLLEVIIKRCQRKRQS